MLSSANLQRYETGFWLFILSEVIVLGSLLVCCLYFDTWSFINLSSSLEISFLDCFLLLGFSVTITAFHHLFDWYYSSLFLLMSIALRLWIVVQQWIEMAEIGVIIFDNSFHASSLYTVGLHFSHVLVGVISLCSIMIVGNIKFGYCHCTLLTLLTFCSLYLIICIYFCVCVLGLLVGYNTYEIVDL